MIRRPQLRKNLVLLDLCTASGTTGRQLIGKSSADYRQARKVTWGEGWGGGPDPAGPGTASPGDAGR